MSSHQSPMVSIPKKTTDEVDWTSPIRSLIAKSYGENPESYAQEYQTLQRCRQDAVKGAGSDTTARDLLYKYFGQLELLELRFSEIRVNFAWHDAFTNKLTTQTSIAYEKASILFQIAATHSAIASSQNRSDPEGLKRAFHYFRTCAGMLTYINDNFLHAPSTDLSREVIKFLVGLILAQATEVFLEKCIEEKKASTLVSKIASQTASMYSSLSEEVKDFMGKGVFDRNWVTLVQIKSKLFGSLAQFYRAQVDDKAGNHGDSLVRLTLAETLAKEGHRSAQSFSTLWSHVSPTLPADAGTSILERTKSHLQICTDRKNEAQRDNDLIYNAVLPSPDALSGIDKASVATPITIEEVYGAPEVQKVIGQDIFIKLIPLSVHESASVYSEEKAKLVRKEVESAESAEVEVRSALEATGVQEGLGRFKAMADGGVGAEDEIPLDVRRWREDIAVMEDQEGVDALMRELTRLKDGVQSELDSLSRELDAESRECETMRVKYDHLWTQEPSASLNKSLRQDLKSHMSALEAASASDQQVYAIWDAVKGDISLMLSSDLEELFRSSVRTGGAENLLDLEISSESRNEQERARIGEYTTEIEERLGRIKKIAYERNEVLKDLKEKIQADDVSHLLLLNRRNTGVEPTLFAAELEKFKPYQQRLTATVHHQQIALQDIQSLWKSLRDLAGRGPGAKKWEEREKRKKDAVRRISRARDGYMEVRDGLTKGLQFYVQLTELSKTLSRNAKSFVSERRTERETLAGQAAVQQRLSAVQPPRPPMDTKPPVPPPPRSPPSMETSFASMNLQGGMNRSSPPIKPPNYSSPVPAGQAQFTRFSYLPPVLRTNYMAAPTGPAPDPNAGLGVYGSSRASPVPPQASAPPPPLRTNYVTAATGPAPDPYAGLGVYGSSRASPVPPQASAPPPPPSVPPRQSSYLDRPPPHSQPSQYTSFNYPTSVFPAQPAPMQHSSPPPPSNTTAGAPLQTLSTPPQASAPPPPPSEPPRQSSYLDRLTAMGYPTSVFPAQPAPMQHSSPPPPSNTTAGAPLQTLSTPPQASAPPPPSVSPRQSSYIDRLTAMGYPTSVFPAQPAPMQYSSPPPPSNTTAGAPLQTQSTRNQVIPPPLNPQRYNPQGFPGYGR